jgi:hypothetical protein
VSGRKERYIRNKQSILAQNLREAVLSKDVRACIPYARTSANIAQRQAFLANPCSKRRRSVSKSTMRSHTSGTRVLVWDKVH